MSSHLIRGRQLSRDTEHRKALRRNLCQSLFEHGKIRTTLPKAKEVKAMAEKLITLARTGSLTARRRVIATLRDRRITDEEQEFILDEKGKQMTVVRKLFSEIAPSLNDRPGGYTRIIKTSDWRIGDGGSIVVLQLVTEKSAPRGQARRSAGLRRKRNQRRQEFANTLKKSGKESAPAADAAPASAESEAKQQ
jgi:large subunit ribosomal protein L17